MPCQNTTERMQHMDRKAKKPLMEKRRRARINKCLGDLKNLLLEQLKRDPSQTSKLEKADILEMTVHLLRRMQQDQLMRAALVQPSVRDRFLEGWRDCAAQVAHYANTVDGMPGPMKESLQRYLTDRYRTIQQTLPPVPAPMINFPRNRSVFPGPPPPVGFLTGSRLIRVPAPVLYPPALIAQQWRAMGTIPIAQSIPVPSTVLNSIFPAKSVEESQDSVIRRELEKVSKFSPIVDQSPIERSASAATTPACFEDDSDDEDDSASCSSSEATNESEIHETGGANNVWRPW